MRFVLETAEETDLAIAKRLAAIRRRRGISQQRLAELSNVSLGSIKRFESCGCISLKSLTQLATALDCADGLRRLFADVGYNSIEEVIREGKKA